MGFRAGGLGARVLGLTVKGNTTKCMCSPEPHHSVHVCATGSIGFDVVLVMLSCVGLGFRNLRGWKVMRPMIKTKLLLRALISGSLLQARTLHPEP